MEDYEERWRTMRDTGDEVWGSGEYEAHRERRYTYEERVRNQHPPFFDQKTWREGQEGKHSSTKTTLPTFRPTGLGERRRERGRKFH